MEFPSNVKFHKNIIQNFCQIDQWVRPVVENFIINSFFKMKASLTLIVSIKED